MTTSPEKARQMITVKQFAEQWQISLPTAYGMTEQPGFPVIRAGRKKLIPLAELEKWTEKQAQGGA